MCEAADALPALDVPEAGRLVLRPGQQQSSVHGHGEAGDQAPEENLVRTSHRLEPVVALL